jgi:hypothetical protein
MVGSSAGAGVAPPGTGGTNVIGQPVAGLPRAGNGELPPVAGTIAAPPTAGRGSVPTGGTGAVTPLPDGGLPAFDGGIEPNRNQVRAGGLCERFATLQCAGEQHCCATPAKNFDACKMQMKTDCTSNGYLDEIAMNMVAGFNATRAENAFTKLEQMASQCDPSATVWGATPEGMRGIFQGTVAPMGSCKPTGLPSVPGYGAALASCTQLATHSCLFTGDGPAAAPTTATCAARTDAGATCFVDANCKDGMYCANPMMKYSGGKCTALKAVGTACTADAECMTFVCRSALCVATSTATTYCVSK